MPAEEPEVVFTPSGRRGRFPVGTPLLQAARSLGVDIDSVCGGRALCGRCQILLSEGRICQTRVTSRADHLSGESDDEREFVAQGGTLAAGRRLACSTMIQGDVVIDVPADSQVHRQVVRVVAEVLDIELDASVRLYYVEVQEPDMHDPAGDLRRLTEALEFEWGLGAVTEIDFHALRSLQKEHYVRATGASQSQCYVTNVSWVFGPRWSMRFTALRSTLAQPLSQPTCVACEPGEVLASSGVMNPQIRFGEDLMSRVSYVMMHLWV